MDQWKKCGDLDQSAMIVGYAEGGMGLGGLAHTRNVGVLAMDARIVLDEPREKNVLTGNTKIAGFAQERMASVALDCMQGARASM